MMLFSPAPYRAVLAAPAFLLLVAVAGCGRQHDTAQLMEQARGYQAKGESKAAIIQLKNILQGDPGNGPARLLLASVYLDIGDMPSAEKELRRALALGMHPGQVQPLLGQVLLQQAQFDRVLDEIKADPQQPALLVLRASALLGLNRPLEARAVLEDVLARHPSHGGALLGLARMAMLDSRPELATQLTDQALAVHPDDTDVLRMKAELLRVAGNNTEALRLYRKVLQLRPQHVQTHIDLASLHIQMGKYSEARNELADARKLAPNSLLLLYTQSLLNFREGQLKAAQDELQQILRAAPEHMPSNLLMGAVLRDLGLLPQAEQYLRKFLESNPQHVYATRLLASVLLKTGNATDALQLLEPLLEQQKNDVEFMALAGECYMSVGKFSQATIYFERASSLAPQAAMLHAALGMSHMGQGDNARAIAELEQASSMDNKSSRAGVLLVLTHLRNRDNAKALAAVQQLEARQGANPLLLNLKGGVQLVSGDHAAARHSFDAALSIDPQYFPALDNLTQLDQLAGAPDKARARLEAALARDKKNPELLTALAKLALEQGQTGAAALWLERAARDNPDALMPSLRLANFYSRVGEHQKAIVLAQGLDAAHPAHIDVLTLLADVQSHAGHADAAVDAMNKLVQLQPGSADLQLRLATAREQAKDNDGALQAVRKALLLKPDLAPAQLMLVRLLLAQADYAQALQAARNVQSAYPGMALGFKLEGDVLLAQKQLPGALRSYQRAFDLQPTGMQLIPLYHTYRLAGKPAEAGARMNRWLSDHPADQPTRLYYAGALLADRDYAGAAGQYDKILKQDPKNIVALNDMAWACWQFHDPRALELAERAYQIAPASAAVADTLGWILANQGNTARALPLLKKASEQSPAIAEFRYHYGYALLKAGNKAAARTQLQQLLAGKDFSRRDEVKALLAQI
jgi:putative PEP-CTERM system TPR-repeat lipoprotein